jgi:hypothetical protein
MAGQGGIMNLKQKLVEIRKHIGILRKTEKGQNCQYIDPAVLLLKATDKMNELNVLLMSNIRSSALTREPNPTKSKPDARDFCVSLEMDMVWHDADSDETLTVPWFAFGTNTSDPSQAGGGALTYAERYFFMKQFNIPTTKDDPDFLKEKVNGPSVLNESQILLVADMMAAAQVNNADYLKYLGVESIEQIPEKNFKVVVAELKRIAERGRSGVVK